MASTPQKSPPKEKKAAMYIALGAAAMFGICLGIGLLDLWGYLDPILDYLGVPK